MRCTAHCTAATFDLERLSQLLRACHESFNTDRSVVHVQFLEGGEAFCFSFGVVVFWQLQESQERSWLTRFKEVEKESLATPESELFDFELGEPMRILNDAIYLPEDKPPAKFAVSFGFAQSVKLAVFEISVDKTLQRCQPIAERLAKRGSVSLSRREIARRIGQLFLERSMINVHLDILDKPEILWENDEAEPYYDLVADYLDLSARQTVLNRRLDIVKEIFDMLSTQLNHRHSATLEWIIILLILFDVVLTLVRDFPSLYSMAAAHLS